MSDLLSTSEQLAAKTANSAFLSVWKEADIPLDMRKEKWGERTAKFFFMLGVAWAAGKQRRDLEQQICAVTAYLNKGR